MSAIQYWQTRGAYEALMREEYEDQKARAKEPWEIEFEEWLDSRDAKEMEE